MAREIELLDSPRREYLRTRFDTAIDRLEQSGLLETLRTPPTETEGYQSLLRRYFKAGIACPFLENESCSIYAQRPMICREYAVTSAAARCADPFAGGVEIVRLPTNLVSLLVQAVEEQQGRTLKVTALPLGLDWVAKNPDPGPAVDALAFLQELVNCLSAIIDTA